MQLDNSHGQAHESSCYSVYSPYWILILRMRTQGTKGQEKSMLSQNLYWLDCIWQDRAKNRVDRLLKKRMLKEPTTHFGVVLWGRGDLTYQSPVLVKRDSSDQGKVEYRDVIRRVGWSYWVKNIELTLTGPD